HSLDRGGMPTLLGTHLVDDPVHQLDAFVGLEVPIVHHSLIFLPRPAVDINDRRCHPEAPCDRQVPKTRLPGNSTLIPSPQPAGQGVPISLAPPMRVLLIANTLPPRDVSGVGEQVLQLAAGLRELGDEVEVLGRGPGGAAGPKVLFPLSVVPAVWRAVRRFRPHVVQVHESDGALAAVVVKALGAWLEPCPFVTALLQVSYIEELRAVRPLVADGRELGRPGSAEILFRWLKAPLQILLGLVT